LLKSIVAFKLKLFVTCYNSIYQGCLSFFFVFIFNLHDTKHFKLRFVSFMRKQNHFNCRLLLALVAQHWLS